MQPNETKTTFTPGMLCLAPGYGYGRFEIVHAGERIARVSGPHKAKLSLLFAAAPDLYAAGEALIRLHDTYTGKPRDDDAISLAMSDMRAALRRARGEG